MSEMAKQAFMSTDMFKLVEAFIKRRGIGMDEVRSINLGADAVLATIMVELIYGEIERPAPEPSTLSIDRVGQVRITSADVEEAICVLDEHSEDSSYMQMDAVLRSVARHWGLEVIE